MPPFAAVAAAMVRSPLAPRAELRSVGGEQRKMTKSCAAAAAAGAGARCLVRVHAPRASCRRRRSGKREIGKSGNASRGRSVGKALALFQVDPTRWPELASDRGAWRRMLESGIAPAAFRPQARPPSPRIARTKTHAHQNPTRTDKADAHLTDAHRISLTFTRIVLHGS